MVNSIGNSHWKRAVDAIPGGNGLLSKRPDRYAPDIWPSYFSSCKGVSVTDLDGNNYIDMLRWVLGIYILRWKSLKVA